MATVVPRDSCEGGAAIHGAPSPPSAFETYGPPISAGRVAKYVRMLGNVDKKEYERRSWYVQHSLFPFLVWWLSTVQHGLGVRGSVGEIGVHHGGFFLALASASSRDEPLFVLDLFDKLQKLNVDGSGKGAWANFSSNAALMGFSAKGGGTRWPSPAPAARSVHAIADASTNVDGGHFRRLARKQLRMFSVDGGHTREATCHDLNLADSYLHDGGIVIVDDVGCCDRQSSWGLGVVDGIFSFFDSGPRPLRLVPFFFSKPKLFLARPEFARRYERALRAAPELQPLLRFDDGWRELAGPPDRPHPPLHPTRYTLFGGQVAMPGRLPAESEVTELWSKLLYNGSALASLRAAERQELDSLTREQAQRKRGFLGRLFHF